MMSPAMIIENLRCQISRNQQVTITEEHRAGLFLSEETFIDWLTTNRFYMVKYKNEITITKYE